MKHTLPTETIQKILNYLSSKPFSEVNGLIAEIQALAVPYTEPAPQQKNETSSEDEKK